MENLKKVAIMQPYFFPYIGYFQLIAAVDLFIVHDRVKYVKKGWINRNRILRDGTDAVISLPIMHDSDALDIRDRRVATDFDRDHLLNRIRESYRRAPFFAQTMPLVESVIRREESNLFQRLLHGVNAVCAHIGIKTPIVPASSIAIDHSLRSQDKVIALARAVHAGVYINAIGGVELYDSAAFRRAGLELRFLRSQHFEYPQFGKPFVPWLSIIDVLMFNPLSAIQERMVTGYDLVTNE